MNHVHVSLDTASITMIEEYILAQEHAFPDAIGAQAGILYELALDAKLTAGLTIQIGLATARGLALNSTVVDFLLAHPNLRIPLL